MILIVFFFLIQSSGNAQNDRIKDNGVCFGFNAHGNEDIENQMLYLDVFMKSIPESLRSRLVIRVTGGTLSQKTKPGEWTDEIIRSWVEIQKKYGFGMVFVVNGNDSPKGQSELIQRWLDQGAVFAFFGNDERILSAQISETDAR